MSMSNPTGIIYGEINSTPQDKDGMIISFNTKESFNVLTLTVKKLMTGCLTDTLERYAGKQNAVFLA